MSEFRTITCCRCQEPFGMALDTYGHLRRSHQNFWCPNGHAQRFAEGKSELEKAREALDAERRERQRAEQRVAYQADRRAAAERSARAFKGQVTRMRNRASAGVCPCCNRTFAALARHMAARHPDFKGAPPELAVIDGGKG